MEKILDKINAHFDSMTKSFQSVAAYIIENYDESSFMTLEQLSSSVGVSTTTVIRFARDLGYSGYASMQKALRIDLRSKVSLPERLEYTSEMPDDELLKQIVQTDISNIELTFNHLDADVLRNAVTAMSSASDIYLLGMRRSFSLASYTLSKLAQVRKNVRLVGAPGLNYPEEISSIKKGDICLAFLFPRYSRTAIEILGYLKNQGIKNIIVTGMNHQVIDQYADILIPCETSCIAGKTSYVAPLTVVDYLVALYTQENKESAMEIMNITEDIISHGIFLGP